MWFWSTAAVVGDLNTGHGIRNSTAQAQGESSLKGCKISCMASLKKVWSQEPQEETTCCNDTLRSAEGCTQASSSPCYGVLQSHQLNQQQLQLPQPPKDISWIKNLSSTGEGYSLASCMAGWCKETARPHALGWKEGSVLVWYNSLPSILEEKFTVLERKTHLSFQPSLYSSGVFPRQGLLL